MSVQDRIKKYRASGGGAGLVRVEVLVPAGSREEILGQAALLRQSYRGRRKHLEQSINQAIGHYGVRVLDNVDLSRVQNVDEKARVLGKALMARGDAKAFVIGRKLLAEAEA